MSFDVLIVDDCGTPYDGMTIELDGLGGSESEAIWLLEALAAKGLKVGSVNKCGAMSLVNGVYYIPSRWAIDDGRVRPLDKPNPFDVIKTKTLILQRYTKIPENVHYEVLYRWLTDDPRQSGDDIPVDKAQPICVSEWQAANLPKHLSQAKVIPNMIPDWVYELGGDRRNTPAQSFIYASAAIKGLSNTVAAYTELRAKNATLDIASPSYSTMRSDDPGLKDLAKRGVKFLGNLPFKALIAEYKRHRSLLYVSIFPETFCIAAAMAEALGLNAFILRLAGKDAMSEVLTSQVFDDTKQFATMMQRYAKEPQAFKPATQKDYRVSTVLPKWLELI